MRPIRIVSIVPLVSVGLSATRTLAAEAKQDTVSAKNVHVVLITGGHPFNESEFCKPSQEDIP